MSDFWFLARHSAILQLRNPGQGLSEKLELPSICGNGKMGAKMT